MEMQTSLVQESPITENPVVMLKNGHTAARRTVAKVMAAMALIRENENGAILLYDLVMTARERPNHEFFPGSQWRLSELGLLNTGGHVHASMIDIILSSAVGEEGELSFVSPIAD